MMHGDETGVSKSLHI